jgi:hypothetical protein
LGLPYWDMLASLIRSLMLAGLQTKGSAEAALHLLCRCDPAAKHA